MDFFGRSTQEARLGASRGFAERTKIDIPRLTTTNKEPQTHVQGQPGQLVKRRDGHSLQPLGTLKLGTWLLLSPAPGPGPTCLWSVSRAEIWRLRPGSSRSESSGLATEPMETDIVDSVSGTSVDTQKASDFSCRPEQPGPF